MIEVVIAKAGGTRVLGELLGIRPQSVYSWRRIPAERVLAIEAAFGISRHDLRPDIYPRSVDPPPKTQPIAPIKRPQWASPNVKPKAALHPSKAGKQAVNPFAIKPDLPKKPDKNRAKSPAKAIPAPKQRLSQRKSG